MTTQATIDFLKARYREPGRHYHSLGHIESMLRLAAEHGACVAHVTEFNWAVWFHDAVLDNRRKDNEEQSAMLARSMLSEELPEDALTLVETFIRATASHELPTGLAPEVAADVALFLDLDMSVLGSDPDDFDRYESDVRLEYAWCDDAQWAIGRRAFLEGTLRRPIFHTPTFSALYEEKAKANILRSIEALSLVQQSAQTPR
jgi:predicted metal-dependent HD superfamily phosphohydrolase